MDKYDSYWRLFVGGSVISATVGFLQGAIPFVRCSVAQCVAPAQQGVAVIAVLLSLALAGFGLWLRGNAAQREAKATKAAALTVISSLNIRVTSGDLVELGDDGLLNVKDHAVAEALKQLTGPP